MRNYFGHSNNFKIQLTKEGRKCLENNGDVTSREINQAALYRVNADWKELVYKM